MAVDWEKWQQKVRRPGAKGILWQGAYLLLKGMAALFKGALACRAYAYRRRWRVSQKVALPTVSVGNIAAGGTGKTPLVALLAKKGGGKVAILTRGYRSLASRWPFSLVASDATGPLFSPALMGDEPYLLAKNLPNSLLVVGKKRRTSALLAQAQGAQWLLLDDGFQHRSLMRDLDICLVGASTLLEKDSALIPLGALREPLVALERAHYIAIAGAHSQSEYELALQQLRYYSSAPCFGWNVDMVELVDEEGRSFSLEKLAGQPVALFAAIGNPQRFEKGVERAGGQVVFKQWFADHDLFEKSQLQALGAAAQAAGARFLLCTEKDAVKLPPSNLPLPLYWAKAQGHIHYGKPGWEQLCFHLATLLKS